MAKTKNKIKAVKTVKKVSKTKMINKKEKVVTKKQEAVAPIKPTERQKPMTKNRRKLLKIQQYKPPEITFADLAIKGKVTIADLDTHIDKWHEDPESTNLLHEYLGLTPVEYKKLLADPANALQEIVEKRIKKKSKTKK
jgi:hypothetical protein